MNAPPVLSKDRPDYASEGSRRVIVAPSPRLHGAFLSCRMLPPPLPCLMRLPATASAPAPPPPTTYLLFPPLLAFPRRVPCVIPPPPPGAWGS